jgi:hypothetical protein
MGTFSAMLQPFELDVALVELDSEEASTFGLAVASMPPLAIETLAAEYVRVN